MGWSTTEVTIAFTIMMGLAGFAAALFGSLVEKMGPRKSAIVAAILFGAGQAGAGVAIVVRFCCPLLVNLWGFKWFRYGNWLHSTGFNFSKMVP